MYNIWMTPKKSNKDSKTQIRSLLQRVFLIWRLDVYPLSTKWSAARAADFSHLTAALQREACFELTGGRTRPGLKQKSPCSHSSPVPHHDFLGSSSRRATALCWRRPGSRSVFGDLPHLHMHIAHQRLTGQFPRPVLTIWKEWASFLSLGIDCCEAS